MATEFPDRLSEMFLPNRWNIPVQYFPGWTTTVNLRHVNTPKVFHNAAQGQRRRRATLGMVNESRLNPVRVPQHERSMFPGE